MGRKSPVRFRFSLRLCLLLVLLASVLFAWIYWLRLLPEQRPGRQISTHPDGWEREAVLRDVYAGEEEWKTGDPRNFIRDSDIEQISRYRTLKIVRIDGRFVTDAGIAHLAKLRDLEQLDISAENVTDEGLRHLHGLGKLKTLRIFRCGVSQKGVQRLRQALPECQIEWDEILLTK